MKPSVEPLLTPKEAALFLKKSVRTIYRYVDEGKLPCRRIGNGLRFLREEVERLVDIKEKYKDKIESKFLKENLQNRLIKTPPAIMDKAGGEKVARSKRSRRRFPYGSIYQRRVGGNWTIDFRTPTGDRIQKVVKAMTWQDAHEVLKEAVYDSYFGHLQKKPRVMFEELADMYIEDHAKINKASWMDDQRIVREMKKFFKGRHADSITAQDVERYKAWRGRQGVKPTTVNKCQSRYCPNSAPVASHGVIWTVILVVGLKSTVRRSSAEHGY